MVNKFSRCSRFVHVFLLFMLMKVTSIVYVHFVSPRYSLPCITPYNHTTNLYVYTPQRVGGVVCM